MRGISIQKTGDLPPAAQAAVEQLPGRTLAADEQISIIASPPGPSVPESPDEVARKLSSFLDRRAEEVRDVPGRSPFCSIGPRSTMRQYIPPWLAVPIGSAL